MSASAVDWKVGSTDISLGIGIGAGVFSAPQANFGGGDFDIRAVRDFRTGRHPDVGQPVSSPMWAETYIQPTLAITQPIGDDYALTVMATPIYTQTLGDGDGSLFRYTAGNPGYMDVDEAYVSLKATAPFGRAGDSVMFTFGRQDFVIDDGFLVQLGRYDIGKNGVFYLSPNIAFDGWGTIRFNTSPVRGDIFVLRTDSDNRRAHGDTNFAVDQPQTDFAGFDIEWFENKATSGADGAARYPDRARYLNFTYFNIYKADRNPALYRDDDAYWARRDGLNVFSIAGGDNLLPIKDTSLYFQYVRQINTHPDRKVDATGYYIEPGYTFSNLPWSPHIYYRYSHYSGEPGHPGEPVATKHAYDFLFYGGGLRDLFGNYAMGEVVGNFMAPNTNLNVHNASVKVTAPFHLLKPADMLAFELIGYVFKLDQPLRAGATSGNYAKEIDLVSTYALDDKTTFGFAAGIASPGQGGRQAIAFSTAGLPGARSGARNSYVFEAFMFGSF